LLSVYTTEYTQSDDCRFLAYMMEKSALAGEGGCALCKPTPFQPITITYKAAVYAPAEGKNTPSISSLPYMYYVVYTTLWCALYSKFPYAQFCGEITRPKTTDLKFKQSPHKKLN
jgi:hypothetical protein